MTKGGIIIMPIEISDWDDLDDINLNLSGNYIQVNDIDKNSTGYIGTGEGWTGIGNSTTEFSGTYNGDGYSISDLFIDSNTTLYRGLFAYIKNATLQNINLYDIDIYDADGRIGGLVGLDNISTTSLIENCHVTGDVGTYTGSSSTTANGRCGGLIGWADGSNIKKCSVQIDFTPEGLACGTFCGRLIDGDIEDSYSISNFLVAPSRTTNTYNGGFIGLITGSTDITNCYFKGDVNVEGDATGGFSSIILGTAVNVDIQNCYVIGDVIFNGVNSSSAASGFVPVFNTSSTVNNCYWVGTITNSGLGNIYAGVAGITDSKITNCFYDLTIESDAVSSSTGKTTAEMRDIDTYTDTATAGLDEAWTMTTLSSHNGEASPNLWAIDDGNAYPILWYEVVPSTGVSVGVKISGTFEQKPLMIKKDGTFEQVSAMQVGGWT